jgi:hypothetical protein
MRSIYLRLFALASLVGCKEDTCLYQIANPYYPGKPGSERLSAGVSGPDGQAATLRFDGGSSGSPQASISGWVTASSDSEVVVDTCDPSAGCRPTPYRLTATAPGLALAIPLGRGVTATWLFTSGWPSSYQRLGILDGLDASADGEHRVWLWAVDSDTQDDNVAGLFQVEKRALSCGSGVSNGCAPADDYAFRFTATNGGAQVTLTTGQDGTLLVTTNSGQQQHLSVHDLRSYQTGRCDDYWNFAWWAAGRPNALGDPE